MENAGFVADGTVAFVNAVTRIVAELRGRGFGIGERGKREIDNILDMAAVATACIRSTDELIRRRHLV